MELLSLLWSFFLVGLFSFGGGYAALPLIQHQVVDLHGWLTLPEFADVLTISQMMPGSIAINAATFVGTKVAGPLGAVVATAGCVLPSSVIATVLAVFYYKYRSTSVVKGVLAGLRPAVVALIASAALSILWLTFFGIGPHPLALATPDWIGVGLFAAALVALRRFKVDAILVMVGCGVLGLGLYLLF